MMLRDIVAAMKISKSTIVFLAVILILSILIANIVEFAKDVRGEPYPPDKIAGDNNGETPWPGPKYYGIDHSSDHLIWFLQITDLHISIHRDPSRLLEFREFCNVTVNVIQPKVVLASGDLTDALVENSIGSKQEHQEWEYYKNVIDQTNVSKNVLWLDVRGNHDNFDVINLDSKNNYYTNYSVQGKKHHRSYMYNVEAGLETYSFIAVDACLKPGPKRPFNFIGILDQKEIKRIQQLINQSKESNAAHTIVFGHYPTSSIISQADTNIRSVLGNHRDSLAYLCGHFHTFLGMVPEMYTIQREGFLELELADWKNSRTYRLAAIDHGQFSFIDIKHQDWPVVLITNPKNVLFMMPQRENLESIIKSTHVRVLAFSTVPIKSIEIQLDNEVSLLQCDHISGPLYTLPWNATRYKKGIHQITVRVTDEEGKTKIVSQSFSLDGSWISPSILAKYLLMTNVVCIFQIQFVISLMLTIGPLCFFRFLHMYYRKKRTDKLRRLNLGIFWVMFKPLWILSTIDRVFYVLMLYTLYVAVGPWTVGEIIEGHTGVIFMWGTFIEGMYLPGGLTYLYGVIELLVYQLPLTLMLALVVSHRLIYIEQPPETSCLIRFYKYWPFLRVICVVSLIGMQCCAVYVIYLEYGTTAILLCPLRWGSIMVATGLWYSIITMPVSCLRSAASVWYPNGVIHNANR